MSLFSSLKPFTWSEQIIVHEDRPYYRCFDKNGRVVGYVRQNEHKTNPLFQASLVFDHKTGYEEIVAKFNTVENAKLCVERNLS